jgi:hypothetical protein
MRTHDENHEGTPAEPVERTGQRRLLIPSLAIVAVLGIAGGAWAVSRGDDSPARAEVGTGPVGGQAEPAPVLGSGVAVQVEPAPAGSAAPATAFPGAPSTGDSAATSAPAPGGAPHTYYPAQRNSAFSRYTLAPDGRTLTTWFWGGACESARTLFVSQSADRVSVRIETIPEAGQCIDLGVEHSSDVTLPTPLGERDVVDAATGAVVTAGGNPFAG